ncbi:hypothetical protein LJR231_004210 [Phyllobacterium sp. LjRoot231]|uniref:hypothetical protein n=1 Tax=Phyllobacterium sp. LjRoot231 TaxID=3342289 RepID=UPI003ECF8DA9
MRILREMITDAVKDYTVIVYSEDVNDPVYWGRDVDKTIAAIKAHKEINVLIRDGGRPDDTVGWVMVLPGHLPLFFTDTEGTALHNPSVLMSAYHFYRMSD